MRATRRILGLVALGLFGVVGQARAQEVQFQGSTKGCFYASWESGCTPGASSTLLYLSFLQSTFDVTTVGRLASVGAGAATPNVNNLGSFALGTEGGTYTGSQFLLDVIFSLPTITSSPSLFSASLRGSVTSLAAGGVSIKFDPSSKVFAFESGLDVGSFILSVDNTNLTPGGSPVALTGDIQVTSLTSTPEPGTTALFATGLVGLVPVFRMRRKKSEV